METWRTTAEALNNTLDTFIDPAYRYDFWQGPAEVRSITDAQRSGLNCIALAHLAINKLFEVELPPELHCAELYTDTQYFTRVDDLAEARRGDLLWFGVANPVIEPAAFVPLYRDGMLVNWRDFPVKHVAVHTGKRDEQDEPLLLHASQEDSTNVIWPLPEFAKRNKRWEKFYGISRLAIANA